MEYEHLIKALGDADVSKLQTSTVSVVGLGGIGSSLADLLVRSGINVRLVEKDRVNEEDLDRLSLFEHKHESKFKATEAKKILSRINPEVTIKSFNEEITEESLFLADADIVLDCSGDNELTPVISEYCKSNGIPHIAGGIRDTKCLVIVGDEKKSVMERYEELDLDKGEGLIPASTRIIAGFMYIKAVKILTGRKLVHNVLVYDVWDQMFEDV